MLGENVAKLKMDLMKEQLATFRSQLEDFARKHKVHPFFFPSHFLVLVSVDWIVNSIFKLAAQAVNLKA